MLATWEAKIGKIKVESQPWQKKKFKRPHFNQWLGIVVHACHSSYTGKHKLEDGSLDQPEEKKSKTPSPQ
jgi:hypothetical protein